MYIYSMLVIIAINIFNLGYDLVLWDLVFRNRN